MILSENHTIDELDKKILSIISKNARTPFLEVARECGVSGAAVHQRVQRLTNIGIITGSEFIVSPQNLGYKTCAFVGINLKKACLYQDIAEELYKIPEIIECYTITGEAAFLLKIVSKSFQYYRDFIFDKLLAIPSVSNIETSIVVGTEKKTNLVPLD